MTQLRVAQYDLHTHSTRSDGTLGPSDVVRRAAERGVRSIALTDHDELSGLSEARAAADEAGIELIDGVEISVTWKGHTIHIVGLRVDPANSDLTEGLQATRAGRAERAQRMSDELERIGIPGTLAGARRYVTNPDLVSRTHFARYLVESGRAKSTQAVFDQYLGEGKPGYVPHAWASLADAVRWIDGSGGLAVVAHPGRYKLDQDRERELLGAFKDLGGVGVEVVTGSHTPDQFSYWAKRAREFGLLASAGSDFHGPRESYRDLGDLPPLPGGCKAIWQRF